NFSEKEAKYLVNFILAQGNLEKRSPRDMMQVYRGMKKDLPNLVQGEFGFALDTNEVFIGGLEGNVNILEPVTKALSSFPIDVLNPPTPLEPLVADGATIETDKFQAIIDYAKEHNLSITIPQN